MLTRLTLASCALFAFTTTSFAQQPFEGTVTYEMKSGNSPVVEMVHHVKGKDFRIDMNMEGQSMSIIMDADRTRQIMVMHKNRQWLDAKAMQDRMSAMMPNMPGRSDEKQEKAPSDLNIKATGQKETIAGYPCEHYTFTAEGRSVDICAAKGLGWYFASPGVGGAGMMGRGRGTPGGMESNRIPGLSNAQLEQWKKLYADGFFPLKMTVAGEKPVTLVVTGISRKPLESSLFEPPAGYQEMKIPGG